MDAMIADVPALSWVIPTRTARVIWLAATAAMDTGTNRTNRRPVLPRSLPRSGSGSICHAALTILGRATVMGVLGRRVPLKMGKTGIPYGARLKRDDAMFGRDRTR